MYHQFVVSHTRTTHIVLTLPLTRNFDVAWVCTAPMNAACKEVLVRPMMVHKR